MTDDLLAAMDRAREDFLDALADVDEDLVAAPGVIEDWSVRDLVVHLAHWAEHAAAAVDLATAGRGDEFDLSSAETEAINARVLAEARAVPPTVALDREAAAFAALRQRVGDLDPSLLAHRLGNGDTVEEVIRYDGPDHYAEHTAHLRAWFGADGDDE